MQSYAIVSPTNLFDNNYVTDRTNYLQSSPYARWVFTTRAVDGFLKTYCNIFASFPTYSEIGIFVNGAHYMTLDCTSNNAINVFSFTLPAGLKTVEIVSGLQSNPSGTVLGSWLLSVYLSGGTCTQQTPTAPQYVLYGDSIAVGGNCDSAMAESYLTLLRTRGYRIACEGWGYRSLFADAPDAAGRTALANQLAGYAPTVGIWLAIGTNDYGLETQSAADFGTAYADLLDKLHTALPTATIWCQHPDTRSGEGANTFGDTLNDYRSQITTAQGARPSYTVLVPAGTYILADGVHFTTAGHAQKASAVAGIL